MPDQKKPDDGTTIVTDPIPDSELEKDNQEAFDFDFSYLGKKEDEKKEEPAEDKAKAGDKGGISDDKSKETEEDKMVREAAERAADEVLGKKEDKPADKGAIPTVETIKVEYEGKLTEANNKISSLEKEMEGYKNVKATLELVEKEPHVFLQKYFPQLAQALDPRKQILSKLREEFGQDFRFDANEAYEEGTPSYKFRLREEELRDQLLRERARGEAESVERNRRHEARYNESKAKVMKQYNLDESGFKGLEEWAKTIVILPEHIAQLKFYDDLVRRAVEIALKSSKTRKNSADRSEHSITEVHAEDGDENTPHKDLSDAFGDMPWQ